MVQTKIRKEASLFTVVLTAVATVFIGIVAGFAHEVSRSGIFGNTENDKTQAARTNSPLFLATEATSGSGWDEVISQITEGRSGSNSLSLSEGALNQVAGRYLDFTTTKDRFLSQGDGEPHFVILPETPVFAMGEEVLQLTVPFELHLFGLVRTGDLVLVGTFDNAFLSPRFRIHDSWINSARVPTVLTKIIVGNIAASYAEQAADSPLVAGWKNLTGINISDRELILEVR